MDKIIIFDTTLRDGEQAAGGTLNIQEKLEIARQLESLGVDVIEAGFPAASPGDFDAVSAIAKEVRKPVICGLSHASANAVDRAAEAVKNAAHPRIHIFLSSSEIHLVHQLKKSREEVIEMACSMVTRGKKHGGRHRVFPDGCQPYRTGLPVQDNRRSHQMRRDHN